MKNKFQGKIAPINKDELWEKIVTHDDFPRKKKSNRRMVLVIFGLGFMIMTGFIYWSKLSSSQELDHKLLIVKKDTFQDHDLKTKNNTNPTTTTPNPIDKHPVQQKTKQNVKFVKQQQNQIENNRITLLTPTQNRNDSKPNKHWIAAPKKIFGYSQNFAEITNQSIVDTGNLASIIGRLQPILLTNTIPPTKMINPSLQHNNKKWSLGIDYLVGYSFNNVQLLNQDEQLKWFYDQEKPVESHAFRTKLHRHLGNNWSIGLGVLYSQVLQKFKVTKSKVLYKELNKQSSPYYTKIIIDSIFTIYHHHNILDFLVHAEKTIQLPWFEFRLGGGFGANINYQFKGKLRDENFNSITINRNQYKKYLSPFAFVQTSISRNINSSLSIHTGFEAQTTRTLAKTDLLKHQYWQIRWQFGFTNNF